MAQGQERGLSPGPEATAGKGMGGGGPKSGGKALIWPSAMTQETLKYMIWHEMVINKKSTQ